MSQEALIDALSGATETRYKDVIIYRNAEGRYHRIGGPAVIYINGTKMWYQSGKRHRVDGPAIVFADGVCAWFLNGEKLNEREYVHLINTGNYLEPRCLI